MTKQFRWFLCYCLYWLKATLRGLDKIDWPIFREDEQFFEWYAEEDRSEYLENVGWLCWCGHWQDDGLCCECCGNEPPWGCDCGLHDDCDNDDEWDSDDWLWYWDHYPGELLPDDIDFDADSICAEGEDEPV